MTRSSPQPSRTSAGPSKVVLSPLPYLPGLSDEVLASLEGLTEDLPADRREVRRLLRLHREETIPAAFQENPYLHLALALQLTDALETLLDATDTRSAEDQQLVEAAVRYFLDPLDAEPDFSSNTGFGDDADVVVAVAKHLGLEDQLPPEL